MIWFVIAANIIASSFIAIRGAVFIFRPSK